MYMLFGQLEAHLREAVKIESSRRGAFESMLLKDRKRCKTSTSNMKAILESMLEELSEHSSVTVEDDEEGKTWIEGIQRYQASQAAILLSWLEALKAKIKENHQVKSKSKSRANKGVKRRAEKTAEDDVM